MLRVFRPHALFIPLLVLALGLMAGCTATLLSLPEEPDTERGTLQIQALFTESLSGAAHQLEIKLKHHSQTRTEVIPLAGDSTSLAFDNLLTGIWQLELAVHDEHGDITHTAESEVVILPETTATSELTLLPNDGTLYVYIDLSELADTALKGAIQRARVNVSPGGYNSGTREEGEDIIVVSREMKPQTYDFQVALYTDDFNAGSRVYTSPWYPVDILPGKEITVHWVPKAGELHLNGTLIAPPTTPEILSLEESAASSVRLTWSPGTLYGTPLEAGWRVYHRASIFDAYSVIAELPYDVTEWEGEISAAPHAEEHSFAVSAYARYEQMPDTLFESARSVPVSLDPTSGDS